LTVTGGAGEGVAYNIRALSVRSSIGATTDVGKDLYWLYQQRAALGDVAFRRILAEHLDPESVEHVINALPDPDGT
jgi:hypothetical protein